MNSLAPETINIASLPFVSFEQRRQLPHCSGIYFVFTSPASLLYIGQAKSLLLRWQQHHRIPALSHVPDVSIAYIKIPDFALLRPTEKACIAFFDPIMNRPNVQHKTGPKPMAAKVVKRSFVLPDDLWDWAAEQPEGASGLLRELLLQERQRRDAVSA